MRASRYASGRLYALCVQRGLVHLHLASFAGLNNFSVFPRGLGTRIVLVILRLFLHVAELHNINNAIIIVRVYRILQRYEHSVMNGLHSQVVHNAEVLLYS